MSRVSTYLNFNGTTEEAFGWYSAVFGTKVGPIMRMGDMAAGEGGPQLTDAEKKLVGHVELPILAGHVLMGTDYPYDMGEIDPIGFIEGSQALADSERRLVFGGNVPCSAK